MARVFFSTSKQATCLRCSLAGSSRWAITNLSDSESAVRTWPCSSAGKDEMRRSTAFAAEVELRVPSTMWPVSAAVRASETLSLSRSSPITMTSGSSRSAARSARAKDWVSEPTSRWLTRQFLNGCTNSTGSSMVRTWSWRVSLKRLTRAARVVDLPDPDGPAHDDQPLVVVGDLGEVAGQADLGDRRGALGDDAEDAVQPLLVQEDVAAVAAGVGDVVAEVELLRARRAPPTGRRSGSPGAALSVCSAVKGSPWARTRSAARRSTGGWPDRDVEVGGPGVARGHEEGVELRLALRRSWRRGPPS